MNKDTEVEVGKCAQCQKRFAILVTVKNGKKITDILRAPSSVRLRPQNSPERTFTCKEPECPNLNR